MSSSLAGFGQKLSDKEFLRLVSDDKGKISPTKVFDQVGGEIALKAMQQIADKIDSSDPEDRKEAREMIKLFKDKIYKSVTPEKSKAEDNGSASQEIASLLKELADSKVKRYKKVGEIVDAEFVEVKDESK